MEISTKYDENCAHKSNESDSKIVFCLKKRKTQKVKVSKCFSSMISKEESVSSRSLPVSCNQVQIRSGHFFVFFHLPIRRLFRTRQIKRRSKSKGHLTRGTFRHVYTSEHFLYTLPAYTIRPKPMGFIVSSNNIRPVFRYRAVCHWKVKGRFIVETA
jgi:hypothetical protein